MNYGIKSALLSGLIIPGLGQIYLKYYIRGLLYAIPTLVYFTIVFYKIYLLIAMIIEKFGRIAHNGIDIAVLEKEIEIFIQTQNLYLYHYLFYLITIIWLVSIIDGYYLGNQKSILEKNQDNQQPQ